MGRTWLHLLLFLATVASTWLAAGFSYSITIVIILLGHELGHYFMAQRYGIRASLPFFIPLPPLTIFSPDLTSAFGTLGAVIRMHGIVPSRKALFDTGVAGPFISFAFSVPAILIGLTLSKVVPMPRPGAGMMLLADPPIFSLLERLVFGEIPKTSQILLHPIGYAGWVGLFVTALNLLPVGQLDGGHLVYALFGRKSWVIFYLGLLFMAVITVVYNPGWLLMLILMVLFGRRHPAPLDDETPLDRRRKVLGAIAFVILLVSFTVSPFPELSEEVRQLFRELLRDGLHFFRSL
jgi:membrane-associated protease RseP (regulator of RpoE activity)